MPGPRVARARRGFSVFHRGKTLLSAVDPLAQGEGAVKALPSRDATLYFCPSPLFGYGLPLLLERIEGREPDSAILCAEADKELLALSLSGDSLIPSLLPHPRLSMPDIAEGGPGGEQSLDRCRAAARAWGSRRFRRVEVLRLSGGWQLYPKLYGALAEALRGDIAADWANAMTLVKLGRRYARNFIRNLSLLPRCPSLSALSFGEDPILVLGAGPSLDAFLDYPGAGIRRAPDSRGIGEKGRSFRILSVDTAIPNLKARGIRPDLVVALESQHWNLRDFRGARGWGAPLAMDLSALPATAEILGGPCYLFFTPWTELNFLDRLAAAGLLPESFPPLGSVGLSAAAAALRLSRGPVILCGIDFSFTLDSYHARSTAGQREKLGRQNRFTGILNQAAAFRAAAFSAPSKSGAPVRSDPAMRNYRDLFEREFAAAGRIMDIEGSGLPLGLPTLGFAEAAAILEAGKGRSGGGGERPPAEPGKGAAQNGGGGRGPEERGARGLGDFILREREALERLREILRGERAAEEGELEGRLDFCDYLWAHFPECAAAGGRRPAAADAGFLKRIRTEIDPFMELFDQAAAETASS